MAAQCILISSHSDQSTCSLAAPVFQWCVIQVQARRLQELNELLVGMLECKAQRMKTLSHMLTNPSLQLEAPPVTLNATPQTPFSLEREVSRMADLIPEVPEVHGLHLLITQHGQDVAQKVFAVIRDT